MEGSDDAAPCPSTTATTTAALVDKKSSTLTLLEHVNLNVPNHDYILDFYLEILGMGLDPRRAGNVAKGNGTVWSNCGATQFHLSFGEEAQVVPGSIGLWYDGLERLKERLSRYDDSQDDSDSNELVEKTRPFESYSIDIDSRSKKEHVRIVDRYGNVFYCRQSSSTTTTDHDGALIRTLRQPLLTSTDVQHSKDYRSSTLLQRFAIDDESKNTDCRGISYAEFYVPRNTAALIAKFYDCVLGAPTNLITTDNPATSTSTATSEDITTTTVAIVGFGSIDAETGKTSQRLLFRESELPIPPYDGHHIALYVGGDQADYEAAFKSCSDAGVVWVNPRFSDRTTNLTGARKWKQFRFKDILDLKTGMKIFELEHEVRSVHHSCWPGKKVIE